MGKQDNKPSAEDKAAKREKKAARRANRQMRREARRTTNWQYNPIIKGVENAYGGLADWMSQQQDPYLDTSGEIAQSLQGMHQNYSSMLNMGPLPQGEGQLGTNFYGSIGMTGQNVLASQQQRGVDYILSAEREGQYAKRNAMDNLMMAKKDARLAELQRLKQEAEDRQADDAFNSLLEQLISNQLGGGTTGPYNPTGTTTPTGSTETYTPEREGSGWEDLPNAIELRYSWVREAEKWAKNNPGFTKHQIMNKFVPDIWKKWFRNHWSEFLAMMREGNATGPPATTTPGTVGDSTWGGHIPDFDNPWGG